MSDDFLLSTKTSEIIFNYCRDVPIFDWHCHLSPKEIYENKTPSGIAELWLSGDHYKWRAMRALGIPEEYITGDAPYSEKFKKWAGVMDYCMGNPLYHWTHLELKRYFNIDAPLSPRTAEKIMEEADEKIKSGGFRPKELIERSNVYCLATTDDPADNLEYHKKISLDGDFKCKVIPAFRPDKVLSPDSPAFPSYIDTLESASNVKIDNFDDLKEALKTRIEFFKSMGAKASDHSFGRVPFKRASAAELDNIFKKAKNGENLTPSEIEKYKTELFLFLAEQYSDNNFAMEIHIGALRNNNSKMFARLGSDAGFDTMDDGETACNLSRLLDSLDKENHLPKTILFCLNPKDNMILASMAGNFQNSDAPSKIQFGSAWWFNDNIDGMREQIKTLANAGLIGKFIGMVTDSRSFLSYPRHEYFRRILCDFLGALYENGEYPDLEILKETAKNISFYNALEYFG